MRKARITARCAAVGVMISCGGDAGDFARFRPPPVPDSLFAGSALFAARCAKCHGLHAVGTDSGPPLLHEVYRASHHGDAAFALAVLNGVRAHHWRFGDMPPQPGLTGQDVRDVTAYVRWLQAARQAIGEGK
jgi:mono/diheme cytochrome c family protein